MKRINPAAAIGAFLILVGLTTLLENLGVLPGGWGLAVALAFALGGLAFVWGYLVDPEWWWAAIPGLALLGIGALIAYSSLWPEGEGGLAGGLFLSSLGAGFLLVYVRSRDNWWALIPCGVLLTLGIVAGLGGVLDGDALGAVFFLGLALTFAILYLLPSTRGHMSWALIPAGVLGVIGLLVLASAADLLGYLWPAALIVGGALLLLRTLRGAN